MIKQFYLFIFMAVLLSACEAPEKSIESENPFFSEYTTPYGIPPFDLIETSHFLPALEQGLTEQKAEIEAITNQEAAATFENTIEAYERSGALLDKVSSVFYNLNSSLTSDTMQDIARTMSPMLSKHSDDIILNPELFTRIKMVYDNASSQDLNAEQQMLLEKTYKRFIRGGALLGEAEQQKLREINEELSLLSLQFGENILAETNKYEMVIDDPEELKGIPENFLAAAKESADAAGYADKYLFTLQKPSMLPVLTYADNRGLREEIFNAYTKRGDNNDEYDNKTNLSRMASLRAQRAKLLGYENHASFVLEQNMAKTPENVNALLDELLAAAMPMAKKEAAQLQKLINQRKDGITLQPWDWWYYAEILRKEKYDLDEAEMRPYFKLENVRDGVFETAQRLWGLQFEARSDYPRYHEDVQVYEVKEADGSHIGVLFMDFFPRASKRGGAWMSSFRKQYRSADGEMVTPIITTNFNFTAPSADKPALLSWDEVQTTFHEMGHAFHGLLSNSTYNSLSGTSVPRDFVELPSQIMEHWAAETEVLSFYAKHYETGEVIPAELLDKMEKSSTFNQGFAMAEFLSAAALDMDWHTISDDKNYDAIAFENASLKESGLIPEIVVRYRSPYFNHIFSGGYSAGYYSYIWSEVLDSDAFEAFKENGIFDQETASLFRENILARGGTADPMELYVAFRGQEPTKDALLRNRGIIK
ncbi:MAG: M3 family metallopeptidase [Bacteroidetes bacterium]|nr:M3 family metallopeptidase [Bacteroidota bacterium]MBU1578456.1 M3 family metallopeptidase [Bacteroidota bacterium]MBU2558964.1 M3 family metallopeptidase [Bacteroidota bacterium]